MVQTAFLTVLGMSVVASIVILAVIFVRMPLKKAPKVFSYALWVVVLFRLLCPFSFESVLSLIPEGTRGIPQSIALKEYKNITVWSAADAAEWAGDDVLNSGIGTVYVPMNSQETGSNEVVNAWYHQVWLLFWGYLWLAGITVMVIYSVVSYLKLRSKLIGAAPLRDNIYLADHITSPFVIGLFRLKIYLPSSLAEGEQEYIILHEKHHIHRLDHIVKVVSFIALCVHWFNPLVWVAFILSAKDMEMSCDEAVLKKLGVGVRADYSASLLSLATGRRIIAGTPLAFGEGDTTGRIKNLAKWKKPALWVIVAAAAVVVLVFAVFGTNSKRELQVKSLGMDGMELTCNFEEAIQSWAIYEDIYLEGELISSGPILCDNFQDKGGASDRHMVMYLTIEDGLAGTLRCVCHDESVGWKATMERDLPRDCYTSAAHMIIENDGNLEPNDNVILYNVILSNRADRKILSTDLNGTLDEIIAANDTVVQYRLVTSTEGLEAFWT